METEGRAILCDPALLQARNRGFARMSALFAGQKLDRPFVLYGVNGKGTADLYVEPEAWLNQALDALAVDTASLDDRTVFRPLFINPWPYGVHFIDRLFGATVYELDGEQDNWQVQMLQSPVGELQPPDMEKSPTWELARRIARAFLEAEVTVPLFAPPVLSSPLNIALNLYGQGFLLAMMVDPDAAHHDLRVITDVIVSLHRWFQGAIPFGQLQMIATGGRCQPPGYGQICGCSTHLISSALYRDFVAPLDDEVLSLYPNGGMIHLCGSHSQQIPIWREMASLRSVQINDRAAEDLAVYFNQLRVDQVMYVNPCDGMPIERIMQITGGQRVVIVADVKEPLPAT